MAADHLRETAISSRLIFDEGFLRLRKDLVRLPDGSQASREVVEHPGAAAVVALTDDGRVVMVRQYRYAPDAVFLEIPAGKLEKGEAALHCAQRELVEETGWRATQWAWLAPVHPAIGFSNERIDVFIARGLEEVGACPDAEEFVEVEIVAVADLIEAIRLGQITDPKTVLGVFAVERMQRGEWAWPQFEQINSA